MKIMVTLLILKQTVRELLFDLRQIWGNAVAKTISFDYIPQADRPSINAVFNNFKSDAERGYFDEEQQKALKTFLRSQGFDKFEINRCIKDFQKIADVANQHERYRHATTQARYWSAFAEQNSGAITPTSPVAARD